MRIKARYPTWFDVRSCAAEESLKFGFAWVLPTDANGFYHIAVGESVEDAPAHFLQEFKDGVAQ